jgi:Ni/Co efflux regulator RcnB
MDIKKSNSHCKRFKYFTIKGNKAKVDAAVEKIEGVRASLKLDYTDYEDHKDGTASAEYICHRQHQYKVRDYLNENFR